ncbi:MAG TPA: FkbM family methyltransferase [Stellaceae bacterium]|nr:FkbM family methyltransferase [Stellaceae bacterium]
MASDVVIRADQIPMALAKHSAKTLHSAISRAPYTIARAYINLLSFVSRRLPKSLGVRIQNSMCQFKWPEMKFGSKNVFVGHKTKILLIPHLGEFDQAALFVKALDYEAPVFEWLAENASAKYDLVIEIGANVGVYTVFLDALTRLPGSKLTKVIAFEPSPEAFRRLLENLRANKTQHVYALQAAIGPESGIRTLFEPAGHLTCGSFVREFAELFADSISKTEVISIAAAELERFLKGSQKALIKIDAEGFEPVLVACLDSLIKKYKPDLLIEVLDITAERLDEMPALGGCRKYLVTSEGLREAQHLFACPNCRDWVLLFDQESSEKSPVFAASSAALPI